MLRYQENNELHRDFHSSTNMTLDYIAEKYGVEALKMILRRTGRNVYKSIHETLARGDASEWVEHLNWFFMREQGKYQLTVEDDKIVFEVFDCPAHRHLQKLGQQISQYSCLQTSEVNAGMCEDTPWESEVEIIAPGRCRQIFRKVVKNDSQ